MREVPELPNEPMHADAPCGRIIPHDGDALLFPDEAAYLLGLRPRSLEDLRLKGGGPDFIRLGRRRAVRYRRRDLIAFIETRRRRSTCDPGPEAA